MATNKHGYKAPEGHHPECRGDFAHDGPCKVGSAASVRGLSRRQREHLAGMIPDSGEGLIWYARGGEIATARSLARRGLLIPVYVRFAAAFELTVEGEAVARELARRSIHV